MLIKTFENGKVESRDSLNVLGEKDSIVIYKESESYIVRKENILTIYDYRDMMYNVYLKNRNNNNIFFVNFSDEEVESVSTEGATKREYKLPVGEIFDNPQYKDDDHTISTNFHRNGFVVDVDYTVSDRSGAHETFKVTMDYIYDVTVTYTDGKIINPQYMEGVVSQLEDKYKTKIVVQKAKELERVYAI